MKNVTVRIIKNTVQTGAHYGKKGQELSVPQNIADQWVALGAAELVAEKKKGSA